MSEKGAVSSGWEDEKGKEEQPAIGNRKLFVGGLPENETSDSVRSQFEVYGEIENIVHKGDYAFITFVREEDADRAIKGEDLREMGSKKISVRHANNSHHVGYLGNLPRDFVEEDIEKLVLPLKPGAIRMIRHHTTGLFKGFCYVDFNEKEDLHEFLKIDGTIHDGRPLRADFADPRPGKGRQGRDPHDRGFRRRERSPGDRDSYGPDRGRMRSREYDRDRERDRGRDRYAERARDDRVERRGSRGDDRHGGYHGSPRRSPLRPRHGSSGGFERDGYRDDGRGHEHRDRGRREGEYYPHPQTYEHGDPYRYYAAYYEDYYRNYPPPMPHPDYHYYYYDQTRLRDERDREYRGAYRDEREHRSGERGEVRLEREQPLPLPHLHPHLHPHSHPHAQSQSQPHLQRHEERGQPDRVEHAEYHGDYETGYRRDSSEHHARE